MRVAAVLSVLLLGCAAEPLCPAGQAMQRRAIGSTVLFMPSGIVPVPVIVTECVPA